MTTVFTCNGTEIFFLRVGAERVKRNRGCDKQLSLKTPMEDDVELSCFVFSSFAAIFSL